MHDWVYSFGGKKIDNENIEKKKEMIEEGSVSSCIQLFYIYSICLLSLLWDANYISRIKCYKKINCLFAQTHFVLALHNIVNSQ